MLVFTGRPGSVPRVARIWGTVNYFSVPREPEVYEWTHESYESANRLQG